MSTNKYTVTIGRQYGSGGRLIGKALSQSLGIEFYDKDLITLAAKKHGMNEKIFESVDERPTNSLLYSLAMGAYGIDGSYSYWGDVSMPLNDKVFQIQADLILELSEQQSCVIVGRCADYVLRDRDNVINIYLYADFDYRVNRAIAEYNIPSDKAADMVKKTDKKRASYYNFHTNKSWGDLDNYSIALNTGLLGEEKAVKILKEYIEMRLK
ncbi:MAG: cytidylate kinase [Clostridiales bacterium]|nr:MAG: cytidylate kinase [Clostridiales bacterium]